LVLVVLEQQMVQIQYFQPLHPQVVVMEMITKEMVLQEVLAEVLVGTLTHPIMLAVLVLLIKVMLEQKVSA
jgi:hypothetical protein